MSHLRDGVSGDLVAATVDLLDGRVVAVLVRHEESGFDVAAVGVLALTVEHLLVEFDVVVVDGVVEADHDHLRHLLRVQFAGDFSSGLGTEAVGQQTDGWVAGWGPVRIRVQICRSTREQVEDEFQFLKKFS